MFKKIILPVLIAAAIGAVAAIVYQNNFTGAKDITGWQKLTWGMTHAEVAKLYKLGPWEIASGSAGCALAEPVKLSSCEFNGFLYFSQKDDSGKLGEITLMGGGTMANLEDLVDSFEKQYGEPTKAMSDGPMMNWEWQRDSATLSVMVIKAMEEESDPMDMPNAEPPNGEASCSIRFQAVKLAK